MKLFWNSRKEEIRMAESQKTRQKKENIVELKTNIYLLSIIGEVEGMNHSASARKRRAMSTFSLLLPVPRRTKY